MRNLIRTVAVVTVTAGLLSACATDGNQAKPGEFGANKTTGGTVLGAVLGGLAGSQVGGGKGKLLGVAGGTLLGAFLGNQVGASLDRADQAYADKAEQQAYNAPIGQQIAWSNPESGNRGVIVPTREGTDQGGRYCREFQQTVVVGGKTQDAYGTACRQPDGSWQVLQGR